MKKNGEMTNKEWVKKLTQDATLWHS